MKSYFEVPVVEGPQLLKCNTSAFMSSPSDDLLFISSSYAEMKNAT